MLTKPGEPDLSDIQAVIVLYKSTLSESSTFKSLTRSLRHFNSDVRLSLLVYDNSPGKQSVENVDGLLWDITYAHDENNSGVSKAYNVGAETAVRANKQWLLLLDQDTQFPENAVEVYVKGMSDERYKEQDLFCPLLLAENSIISPCKFRYYRGTPLKQAPKPGIFAFREFKPINSGLLVSLKAFQVTGGYNNRIKLDFSDFDFIGRFSEFFKEGVLLPLQCSHGLSTHSIDNLDAALARFNYYVAGARELKISMLSKLNIEVLLMLRAARLSSRFQSLRFFNYLSR